MNTKPKKGFAIKEAGTTVDPYQNYSDSVLNNDEIWNALLTEAGRQAIGAQMAVPIRTQLDYVGTARKFFEIDVLAQGQIARYDKDINVPAYVVSKRGKVDEWTVEGEYVEPNTWEIFAPASIRLKEIQERRFNILDRTQEKIRIAIQEQEDEQFLHLLNTVTQNNTNNNPITTSTTGCDKYFLNNLSSIVMDHDLPCYGFLMRFASFKDIRGWDNTDLDPVTMREILETGLYGTIWGIDIIVSRKVPKGTVYAIAEPRFFGVLPIRTEVILMPNDIPAEAKIGYVGYENLGMAIVNANGVSVGSHN
uniref:Major capsid protein n=1 Tax=Dictyoglomus turgidum TaxID=513050 RepID=A0A7C3WUY7_9BACT